MMAFSACLTFLLACQSGPSVPDSPFLDDILDGSLWVGRQSPCGRELESPAVYLEGFEDASVELVRTDACVASSGAWSVEALLSGSAEVTCFEPWYQSSFDNGRDFSARIDAGGDQGSFGAFYFSVHNYPVTTGLGHMVGILFDATGESCTDYSLVLQDW